jgi:hypothetical protein
MNRKECWKHANKHAGSITIHYNPATQNGDQLLDCINQFECLECYKLDCQKPQSERSSPIKTSGTAIASRAGQLAFGMLLENGVRYSMKFVLGVQGSKTENLTIFKPLF